MEAKFTVLGEPKGKGRPRFATQTGRAYTPTDTMNYENLVRWEYVAQCHGYRFPDDAMLELRITAFYSVPKSDSKKRKAEKLENSLRPTKKPDMDNVIKIVADSLNQVAYRDDTQIVDCIVRKFFSEQPRVDIMIREADRNGKNGNSE